MKDVKYTIMRLAGTCAPYKYLVQSTLLTLAVVGTLGFLTAGRTSAPAERPNVLFIAVDDLRPDLDCYGNRTVRSPHLDRLAAQSALFTRQYVTQPTCGASRYSLLTGKLPRNRVELKNEAIEQRISGQPRTEVPETFVDQLRRQGYYTVGIGKISHSPDGYVYGYNDPKSTQLELPHSWDEMLFDAGRWGTGWNAFFGYADGTNRQGQKGQVKPYEAAEVPDDGYPDGLSARLATQKLRELAQKKQPFFLGVGFFKPHLPFTAPRPYWDLYDEAKIPLSEAPDLPQQVHAASLHASREFNQYLAGEESASLEKPISDAYARKLRHAYYACVSYTDALIGQVLAELTRLKLDQNTIVVVWSDHGWHLGDQRVWGKHTLFEKAVRSVLIVRDPRHRQGSTRTEVVSSVDLYPTLMELCGLPTPAGVDGQSFARLVQSRQSTPWNHVAYSYYNQGISVRTDRYRLSKYFREHQPVVELYDYQTDPHERRNRASEQPALVEQLSRLLEKGNTGLYQD
ncbi:sulfatase [Rhabdobacter roseus]|uniref:Arylsulfatase A-like enzyme n=1 Tax=Rhabdobacter roseus TaxID=1655419 RepID=A0A840U0I4_9BACT|nr:sulfatase [Rhabdobacter roseus]MBB5285888.1 arylsulfatase A-like enzyme [Rhabdobacter roseus]